MAKGGSQLLLQLLLGQTYLGSTVDRPHRGADNSSLQFVTHSSSVRLNASSNVFVRQGLSNEIRIFRIPDGSLSRPRCGLPAWLEGPSWHTAGPRLLFTSFPLISFFSLLLSSSSPFGFTSSIWWRCPFQSLRCASLAWMAELVSPGVPRKGFVGHLGLAVSLMCARVKPCREPLGVS